MAWGASDLSARWFTDMAADMSMLARALNEREYALTENNTNLVINTGGTINYPSASQLSGLPLHGVFADNLLTIQNSVIALINSTGEDWEFTQTLGGTVWTVSSMESDIGLGAFPTTPEITNGNDWERIRKALDRLLYVHVALDPTSTSNDRRTDVTYDDRLASDTAWGNCIASSPSSDTGGIVCFQSWVPNEWYSIYEDNSTYTFNTNKYMGTFYNGEALWASTFAAYHYRGGSNSTPPGWSNALDITLDGNSFSVSSVSTGSIPITVVKSSTLQYDIDCANPSNTPFGFGSYPDTTQLLAQIMIGFSIEFDNDISGLLTDQA